MNTYAELAEMKPTDQHLTASVDELIYLADVHPVVDEITGPALAWLRAIRLAAQDEIRGLARDIGEFGLNDENRDLPIISEDTAAKIAKRCRPVFEEDAWRAFHDLGAWMSVFYREVTARDPRDFSDIVAFTLDIIAERLVLALANRIG